MTTRFLKETPKLESFLRELCDGKHCGARISFSIPKYGLTGSPDYNLELEASFLKGWTTAMAMQRGKKTGGGFNFAQTSKIMEWLEGPNFKLADE